MFKKCKIKKKKLNRTYLQIKILSLKIFKFLKFLKIKI